LVNLALLGFFLVHAILGIRLGVEKPRAWRGLLWAYGLDCQGDRVCLKKVLVGRKKEGRFSDQVESSDRRENAAKQRDGTGMPIAAD